MTFFDDVFFIKNQSDIAEKTFARCWTKPLNAFFFEAERERNLTNARNLRGVSKQKGKIPQQNFHPKNCSVFE